MGLKSQNRPAELDELPAEAEDVVTSQESIPVPYLAGTRLLALRWITDAMSVYSEQAPDSRPEKK